MRKVEDAKGERYKEKKSDDANGTATMHRIEIEVIVRKERCININTFDLVGVGK